MLKIVWRGIKIIILAGLAGILIYLLWLPYVPALKKTNPKSTAFMALREKQARESGRKLRTLYVWKDLDDISPHLVHAVVLAEDDTFYQHRGFDVKQIHIAIKRNWEKKRYVYGGSTMTQQLARTLYLSPNKNLLRKAKEALIAILLERYLTKKRILELYLNVAEWGRGVYGAEAAAQAYFQKPAIDLTPDEAASLASILPSPRRWSPVSERAFMARRRTNLVARMRAAGYLPVEVSTAPVVPEEIQAMAEEGNLLLDHPQPDPIPLQIPTPVPPAPDESLHVPAPDELPAP